MAKKVEKSKKEEVKEKALEKKVEKKQKKKIGKIVGIIIVCVLVLGGGAFGLKQYLTRTQTSEETIQTPEDMRSFSNFFKEYLKNRIRAQNLFSYQFREFSDEEILTELTELKDGFSKISRGMNGFDKESEYGELAEVMKSDAAAILSLVRELRGVMTADIENEGDRQLAFMNKVQENEGVLRSELYLSRSAFSEETGGLTGEGILIFEGSTLVEVGGGVMNVFVGDVEKNVTAITLSDFNETIKTIDAKRLFGYTGSRLVPFGESVKNEVFSGTLMNIAIEISSGEAKVTRKQISLFNEATWSLVPKLEREGISGLIGEKDGNIGKILSETLEELEGK